MTGHWQKCLEQQFGIKATLRQLEGEYDLNFLAQCETGDKYILKVMRTGCDADFVDAQIKALNRIRAGASLVPVPGVIATVAGNTLCLIKDENNSPRVMWLLEHLPGGVYAGFKPKSLEVITQLGEHIGNMDRALEGFEHPQLSRDCKWNLARAQWIEGKINCIKDPGRRALVGAIISQFRIIKPHLDALPDQALHNDVNDYNILVSPSLSKAPAVSGIIDLGDMIAAPRVCELAIAGAYVVLDHDTPLLALTALVAGYHAANPLTPQEISLIKPLLKMRLAVSVVNSTLMAVENPGDPYVTISQQPAWRYLEREDAQEDLLEFRLLAACNLPVTQASCRIHDFLAQGRGSFAAVINHDLGNVPLGALSVEASTIPQNPFDLQKAEALGLGPDDDDKDQIWLGYYNEPRLIYTGDAFRSGPWKASNRRTVHLGVDIFARASTPVLAPLAARVEVVEYRAGHLDYGGMVILSHETPEGDRFYTLYGHLAADVCQHLTTGQHLEKNEQFATLGTPDQNGGWLPHLHFQLALTTKGMGRDWPGVADADDLELWNAICPNPAALLNLPDEKVDHQPLDHDALIAERKSHFGTNVKLSYKKPVLFLRGWKHHLFDESGRPFLDAYNNVPHVGHAHPRIQAVAADQLRRMNSNTRYLHPAQTAFAKKILSKMPENLEICFFVNSGTEANELALRLARAHSGAKHMITPDHGYHGHTTGAIDISAYKFNKPGGVGQQDWVHLVSVADDYQGAYRRDDPRAGEKYARDIDQALADIAQRGGSLAGFIAETFPSVAGQIIPPAGYLKAVYQKIRASGGVCIADEVQTGLGRLGDYYFGFEQQQVVPDIVVLGKPIGNGHPLGVLVTTREIADSFDNGIEFFSTFGGSNLSCLIGKEVLDIVDEEGLQENAAAMGARLKEGLMRLKQRHEVIGDVRGMGLFLGVELVKNRDNRERATGLATYVLNRMRENRILIGIEGPYDNVLKIRPPLTIDRQGVDMILHVLDEILSETACAISGP